MLKIISKNETIPQVTKLWPGNEMVNSNLNFDFFLHEGDIAKIKVLANLKFVIKLQLIILFKNLKNVISSYQVVTR